MKKLLITYFFILSMNACGIIVSKVIPLNNLPKPTGPFNIGTQVFEWEDLNRQEWFTSDSTDFRRLVLQIWYPTQKISNNFQSYLDYPEKRIRPLSQRIELPKFLIKHIKDVKSNSIPSAPFMIQENVSYPLILFSHGLGGMRMQNTVQMEELASWGYVVLAMDHPYDANITIFNDGSIADFRSGLSENATEEEFWNVRLPQINTRAADISFILDKIEENKNNFGQIWEILDLSKIGIFGHSYGGTTSIVASYNDSRIDACINLDGWMEPVESKIIQEGLNIPFLYVGQEKWKDTPLNDIKLDSLILSSNGKKVLIKGTKHFDYSDTPQFSPMSSTFGIAGSMDIDLLRSRINSEIFSFFNLHLRGSE